MQRSRKSRRKLWAAIIALGLLVLGLGIYLEFYLPHAKRPDPLAGFTIMDLPRRDVDVGALWTQGIGPIRGSSGVPRLQTRSLEMSEISRGANFDASIVANLARSLHFAARDSTQAERTLKLKGLSIVTVADASKLSSVAGNNYLWEAVRVDQFSVIASQSAKADASAKIRDVAGADKIEERVSGGDSVELTAEGSRLYVAYRVVTISQPTLSSVDETEISKPSSDVSLGREYALHFAPSLKGETFFTKDCGVTITVSSYLILDSKARPTQSNPIKVPCGSPQNQRYLIGSIAGSQRATIDFLQVKDLKVGPAQAGEAMATGTFAVERRTMQLETLKDPSAAGW